MSIIQSIKNFFSSPEVKQARHEVQDQAEEYTEQVQKYASDLAQEGKKYATQAYEQAQEAIEEIGEQIQNKIDFDTFLKSEIRVGTILSVESIEKSDKLLKLMVDVGEEAPRQIISGIAPYFADPQTLVKRQGAFVTNLEPKKIFGYESNGMIFAVNDDESFSILSPDTHITPGTRAS